MTPTSLSGHQRPHRGKSDEWYTPPEIFEALGLDFNLDPCSPEGGPVPWVPSQRFLTKAEDGLTAPWDGLVWMNPPYGPEVGKWLDRLARHDSGLALVPARTDTRWFHDYAAAATEVCFLRGRPHFYGSDMTRAPYNSGAPIMLLAFGPASALALCESNLGMMGFFFGDSVVNRGTASCLPKDRCSRE